MHYENLLLETCYLKQLVSQHHILTCFPPFIPIILPEMSFCSEIYYILVTILFHRAKFLTFSSIEKRHHQTEDLHEGRHLKRDWWEISLLFMKWPSGGEFFNVGNLIKVAIVYSNWFNYHLYH